MSYSTAPVRRFLVSCCAAASLLVAATGCRSAQSAYQFRPAPAVATVPRPTAAAQPLPPETPAPAAIVANVTVARPAAVRLIRRPARGRALAVPGRLARQLPPAGRSAYAAVEQPARRRAGATDGVQATAEVGLGTTVLGVLGLIIGPISLIGLLIWGGPVWAVLLGLSALAVLVAYLDPFR